MVQGYGFQVDEQQLHALLTAQHHAEAFELVAEPLHVWLYDQQDFDAIHERSAMEKLILGFDYVQQQVGQGGFIQLIQNGYVRLLVTVIEALQELCISPRMIGVLDDVLKVYVLNRDVLGKETTVEEFGRLYAEFREFEPLEERFREALPEVMQGVFSNQQ